jgi:antitoxin component of RelBE/YafQ-DinJ toxin-antitoxin module
MKVTVRVDVERDVRDEAARQLAEQGLTIDETMRIVLEQTAAGCGPDFGALVPNATTVEAIEAVRRGEVVELGTPAEALAELNRDD